MRTSMFGDPIIESASDDLGLVERLQEAGDEIYAVVTLDRYESGKFYFEIMNNSDGEGIVSSEPIFETFMDAADYLRGFVTDIQAG
ncbi:MAG: hypothetical protein V3R87_02035 [Dehalococcoidia bacterium]